MAIDSEKIRELTKVAVKTFWGSRDKATANQKAKGNLDAGSRSAVTAGKNMDGFFDLAVWAFDQFAHDDLELHFGGRAVKLPGYFRPTKDWDIVMIRDGRLVAAIELKSQVGSFGNNFNNRTEEAIGSGVDLRTAYRDGALGRGVPPPFLGWMILIEDYPKSRTPVRMSSEFEIFPEFAGCCYSKRYHILCEKLVTEEIYNAACFLRSPQSAFHDGEYAQEDKLTGIENFIAQLSAHLMADATL